MTRVPRSTIFKLSDGQRVVIRIWFCKYNALLYNILICCLFSSSVVLEPGEETEDGDDGSEDTVENRHCLMTVAVIADKCPKHVTNADDKADDKYNHDLCIELDQQRRSL